MPENMLPFRPHRLDSKLPPSPYLRPRHSSIPLFLLLNISPTHRPHRSISPLHHRNLSERPTHPPDRPHKIIKTDSQLSPLRRVRSGLYRPPSLTAYIVRANTLSAFFTPNSDVRTRPPSFPSLPVHYTPSSSNPPNCLPPSLPPPPR